MLIAAAIYPNFKYSPTKSFVSLAMIGQFPPILIGAGGYACQQRQGTRHLRQAAPDKANYPSTSPAITIPMEELKLASGMSGVMIPYKSSAEMVLSVIDGQTMTAIIDPPPTLPQVEVGKLKALTASGRERDKHGRGRLSEC